MGLLGNIFSTIDTQKRKLTDLLGNPVESVQQIVGNVNDRARNLNELTAAAAQEKDLYGPKSQQLASLLAEAYNPIGLTVYHGSPAKFTKFDPTKIGSGEGAQAYGYGHYVAESPDVAKSYQTSLSSDKGFTFDGKSGLTRQEVEDLVNKKFGSKYLDGVIKPSGVADSFIDDMLTGVVRKEGSYPKQYKQGSERAKIYDELRGKIEHTDKGAFYEIDLPDEQIAKMLDWDKPFSEQPKNVQEFFANHPAVIDRLSQINAERTKLNEMYPGRLTNPKLKDIVGKETTVDSLKGSKLYEILTSGASIGKDEAARVDAMRQAGVPGIRYLDQGSRGTGEGTSNFVVFPGNEGLLTIQKRNNEVIAPTSLLDIQPNSLKSIEDKYKDVSLDLYEKNGAINLSRIVVPKDMRNTGVGSNVMSDLVKYADETGQKIALTPSSDFGGSVSRLKEFYKRYGFVENKGKNKDFTIRETMIRLPK